MVCGHVLDDFGKKLPERARARVGMAIARETVGQQRLFKDETHSFSKLIGVFEVHQSDPTTPKGGYSVNQVAQGGQVPYFQEIDLPM